MGKTCGQLDFIPEILSQKKYLLEFYVKLQTNVVAGVYARTIIRSKNIMQIRCFAYALSAASSLYVS